MTNKILGELITGALIGAVTGAASLLIAKDIRKINADLALKAVGAGATFGAIAGILLIDPSKGVEGYTTNILTPSPEDTSGSLLGQILNWFYDNH